jgi:hypothetical protein
MGNRKDPARAARADSEEKAILQERKQTDANLLSPADFKPMPKRAARFRHPFDGYPMMPKVKVGEYTERGNPNPIDLMVSPTEIVGLNPAYEPVPDISGENANIATKEDMLNNVTRTANLGTYHSRLIIDLDRGNKNIDIVFDRVLEMDGRQVHIAIVPSHSARAQLAFKLHQKTKKIETDSRYFFPDQKQAGRLYKLFQMIISPKLKMEQRAAMVAGETDATESDMENLPTEL